MVRREFWRRRFLKAMTLRERPCSMISADKQTSHSREWLFFAALGVLLLGLVGCARETVPVQLGGPTMGTTWSLTYVPGSAAPDPAVVQPQAPPADKKPTDKKKGKGRGRDRDEDRGGRREFPDR